MYIYISYDFSFFLFFFLFFFFFFFFFFFSSRRRNTRWNCDWSSDVCSSDLFGLLTPHVLNGALLVLPLRGEPSARFLEVGQFALQPSQSFDRGGIGFLAQRLAFDFERSEERRVGKECRSRWAADVFKKTVK